jgi:outer membrane protein assembly factor BamB
MFHCFLESAIVIGLVFLYQERELQHTSDSLEQVQKAIEVKDAVLVDVRDDVEWNAGHILQAVHLPYRELQEKVDPSRVEKAIGKPKIVYTYCMVGFRSLKAAKILQGLGYEVRPLKPGYKELVAAGFTNADASSTTNWGHWRGPTGNGTAVNATPPTQWNATNNVKWKVAVPGKGSSSPVVWENQVFVTSGVPTGKGGGKLPELDFTVFAYDRATGMLNWKQSAVVAVPHEDTHSTNGFASASPCTDGRHVYAHFGSRGLFCFTIGGSLVWKRDDFGKMKTRNTFGEGSSPTLHGDVILVPWDHDGPSALYALDKMTGKTKWKTVRDEPTNWATPLVVEFNGKKQVVMNGQTKARSYDFETGKELWSCGGQTERPVPSAVAGSGLVFVGSGYRGAFLGAFKMDGQGDIQGTDKVAWTIDRDTPDIGSPLYSNGRVYFHKGKSGQLSCVDAVTGKPFYMSSRIEGLDTIYASPIAAGGYVFLTARNGTTTVIKDSDTLDVVSVNNVGETVDATPAPSGKQLFIRGEQHLFCIGNP